MTQLLNREQFLQLTPCESIIFFNGLKARESYKIELISLGLEKHDIDKLLRQYYKANRAFIPERFRKLKNKKQTWKYHH